MARFVTIPIGPIFTGGTCRGIIHVIKKGDTLYKLGRRYRVSISQIMYSNPYVNVYNLQVGDELCIPVGQQSHMEGEIHPVAEERMRPGMDNPAVRRPEESMWPRTEEDVRRRIEDSMWPGMEESVGPKLGEEVGRRTEADIEPGMEENVRRRMEENMMSGMDVGRPFRMEGNVGNEMEETVYPEMGENLQSETMGRGQIGMPTEVEIEVYPDNEIMPVEF